MNAKKIMGAVLVALLALTAFAGVAAAEGDQGTYFVYQQSEELEPLNGTWTNGAASVVIEVADGKGYILPVGDFVPGTYTKGKDTITVIAPTVSYKISADYKDTYYLVANGGNIYNGSDIDLTITPLADVGYKYVLGTIPGQGTKNMSIGDFKTKIATVKKTGTYKVQVIFNGTGFIQGVPADILLDQSVFTFKVVDADEATISASVDTVYSGETVTFTVNGTPGVKYAVNATGFEPSSFEKQLLYIVKDAAGNQTFTMPNTGKAVFTAKVNTSEDEAVIKLLVEDGNKYVFVDDAEIEITVSAPVVTAALVKPSYFIGDVIKVTGTSTNADASKTFKFVLTGTNTGNIDLVADIDSGKNWKANLTLNEKVDVGTYTIKIYQGKDVVATLAVALKQPFISIAEAPEVIAQNESATFLINAEAATGVKAYFFGTNYFKAVDAKEEKDDEKEVIPGLFNVTLGKESTNKEVMATGQYFAVFQHPMYDEFFNIYEKDENSGNIVLNATGNPNDVTELFNAKSRQTANAAQALCDALDSQSIDDMYVKYSFFVVEKLEKDTFSMSEIPTEVVKGDKIVISGVDTASKKGTPVTVEMISTAFAAVPKETVGSAAFIVVTTTVAEDGTWEVTLDTSDLNVDEYSLSVAIDSVPKESVTVDVVEAGEPVTPEQPEQPEQPENPEEPVAPATPGFGALAALAGLGAVAVLLLRRE